MSTQRKPVTVLKARKIVAGSRSNRAVEHNDVPAEEAPSDPRMPIPPRSLRERIDLIASSLRGELPLNPDRDERYALAPGAPARCARQFRDTERYPVRGAWLRFEDALKAAFY